MYRYAQIDSNGYVVSDSWLSGEVKSDNMIPLADDFDLTGKRYENGKWVAYIPEAVEPEPTQEEIQAQILLNQAEILMKHEEQDAVLAEILLNQMKGGEGDV